MARMDEATRVRIAAEALHEEFGNLSSVQQIEKADRYCGMLRNAEEDNFKYIVLLRYLKLYCDARRVWGELYMYRSLGQVSSFLVCDEPLDNETFAKLKRVAELWACLGFQKKIHLLFQHEDYKNVKKLEENGSSAAEVFRAYLEVHKQRADIELWTKEDMNEVRYAVYEGTIQACQEGEFRLKFKAHREQATDTEISVKGSAMVSTKTSATQVPEETSTESGMNTNLVLSDLLSTLDGSCLERSQTFQAQLKAAEEILAEKQKVHQEAEEAAEQGKTRFRNIGREAQVAESDSQDRRDPDDWSPAALRREADEFERLARLKREVLLAVTELVEKERELKAELTNAKIEVEKYREKLQKLKQFMDLARELHED